jgi:hypothetical protein
MTHQATTKGLSDNAADYARRAMGSAASGAQHAADELAGMQDRVARQTGEIADKVSTTLKHAGVGADEMAVAIKEQAGTLQQMMIDEVRARPMRALAVAAIAGLVVGYISLR